MTTKTIQFLRGPAARLSQITPANGEPVWVQDTKEFRMGDGTTAGGVALNFVVPKATLTLGDVAIWDLDGTLTSIDQASLFNGYATTDYVDNGLATKLNTDGEAVRAAVAGDAEMLGGQPPSNYFLNANLSNDTNSTSESTVATSLAVKSAYDRGTFGIQDAASAQATANSKIASTNYATNTTGGTVKMRVSGDTLYLTNNGNNA